MYAVYVDASVAVKLFADEPQSQSVATWLSTSNLTFVASRLTETELRRVAARADVPQTAVTEALSLLDLIDVPQDAFFGAGIHPDPKLRSLDALHVTMASIVGAKAVATYDQRMAAAANSIGLAVVLPPDDLG